MSRESRKAQRKARRAHERANPKPQTVIPWKAARNRDTRWQGLSARGGIRLSYTPMGTGVPVDLDDPVAEHALAMVLAPGDVDA